MGTTAPTCPIHKPNPKRSEAKLKRNRGVLAMKKANMNQIEWTRKFDPNYRAK